MTPLEFFDKHFTAFCAIALLLVCNVPRVIVIRRRK